MSGPLEVTEPHVRERRPSERSTQLAEQRREKEDARRKSAERAEQRRKNKAAAEQKVAQRERARSENEERLSDTNRVPSRDPSTITGRDPVFTSGPAMTRQSGTRKRTPIVPSASSMAPLARQPTSSARSAAMPRLSTPTIVPTVSAVGKSRTDQAPHPPLVLSKCSFTVSASATGVNDDDPDDLLYSGHRQLFPYEEENNGDDLDEEQRSARTESPICGDKRRLSSASLSDLPYKSAKVCISTGAKPKASDFDTFVQSIIREANAYYRSNLSLYTPYPSSREEIKWVKESWDFGCDTLETQCDLDTKIISLIRMRTSHFRGRLKSKVQPHVKNMYGFVGTDKPKDIQSNINLVNELKYEFNFIYKDRGVDGGDKIGIYQHPLIQQAVNEMWFNCKKDDGFRHPGVYKPFPKAAFVLILTVIENCIDEWTNGAHVSIPFTQNVYEKFFNEHLKQVNMFELHTKEHNILPTLLMTLYQNGRLNVRDSSQYMKRALSPSAYAAAIKEFQNGN